MPNYGCSAPFESWGWGWEVLTKKAALNLLCRDVRLFRVYKVFILGYATAILAHL